MMTSLQDINWADVVSFDWLRQLHTSNLTFKKDFTVLTQVLTKCFICPCLMYLYIHNTTLESTLNSPYN